MLNKACIIGNVGQDLEIKNTTSGIRLATFSVATTDNWKDKNSGERKSATEWHKIVVYNDKIVEFCKNYVKKGSKLYIEGKIQTRKYLDKNEVKERYITEIIVDFGSVLTLLDSKQVEPVPHFQEKEPESKLNEDLDTDFPY